MSNTFPHIFTPLQLGKVWVKNRIAFLPMTTGLVDDYQITDEFVDFYEQRARGGVGLTAIGSAYVCDLSGCTTQYPTAGKAAGIWDDRFIEGWQRVADAIRGAGSVSCVQLQICYEWRADASQPLEAVGPSDGPGGPFVKHLRELRLDEIKLMIKQYGDAAVRAQKAGFDVVEVHAGIGYQVSRFLSSFSNRRTDEYGGTLEKRTRLLTDILDEIHQRCGDDFPVMVRISADDFMPGGNRVSDTRQIIPIVERHGVAAWSIQAGFHEAPRLLVNQFVPEAAFVDMARQCKQVSRVPVIASYRINTIDRCESIVGEGHADMVGMARQLIADPEFAAKAEAGHPEQIRECIVCSRCLDNIFVGKKVQCSVNAQVAHPELGFGAVPRPLPTGKRKSVVVIGGGPGGMEAARVAALRGHRVTLLERNARLGGALTMAQVLNENLQPTVRWYRNEMSRLPIDVHLNTEATVDVIRQFAPDEIIVSPGGSVINPKGVRGLDRKNVISSGDLKKLVEGHTPPGHGIIWNAAGLGLRMMHANPGLMRWGMGTSLMIKKRVAVIGGGFAGCEVAMSIMRDRDVTIIEESPKLGNGIGIIDRRPELNILTEGGVKTRTGTRLLEVTAHGILVEEIESGQQDHLEVDTVILTLGVETNDNLYRQLCQSFDSVHLIGDASTPTGKVKRTLEAISEGYCAAMAV
ncbi:FAD-dependent oxidoreductase [Raineyella fluvialis]|uniref:NAD(P)-binding protein n=1 Tax=Raineyella fluvialis TaxID=2662261 RepID=A0A5Q2FAN8_9ACTN|nr:FAD-dependent oxidoreductase [Raineyella fluvialis]QGF22424.1 NAD(P)-binding protein [Raineyella fluvialis]